MDIVDLSLGLDNRGADSLGSLKDSWDSNGKIGSSWLVDLGGISGNIAGLSIVNLLGDNWCGLVNGGDSGSLFSSGVRCWGSRYRLQERGEQQGQQSNARLHRQLVWQRQLGQQQQQLREQQQRLRQQNN